ncbi:MAG: tRNA lysidine(34) synthetase TilS [Desulfobulbaceae bacterium]|jgi:tRNA(Ile)-lysidine synthase|nr:tRNA lysidine(34) synthetase TilS [Desulfobulbaceae bacterium]
MHGLEKKIHNIIRERQLLLPDEVVLVGVSGGPDSTGLLLILHRLQQPLGFSIHAVYVDHGLRPDETPGEQEFLTELCAKLGIPLTIRTVDVSGAVAGSKESVEQAARKLRYGLFATIAKGIKADKIAVGHTADDQAEELILRLLRGTARAGMGGMKLLRDNLVVRPLLQVTKGEIITYLADRKIAFMEDSSNRSPIYLRNQVRLELLPFLRNYNPAIDVNLRSLAQILQDEEELLEEQTDGEWDALVTMGFDPNGLPTVQWQCAPFNTLHIALRRRLAEKMFITMESPPSSDKIKQLLYLVQHGQGGSRLHFAHGLRALKTKGGMHFWYPGGKTNQKGNLF